MATTQQESPQSLADEDEQDTAARYQRRQEFFAEVANAVRRAETMNRLELQLQLIRDDAA